LKHKKQKNNVKTIILNNKGEAMLTQLIIRIFITSSILFILYIKKKSRESTITLFQMLKIQELSLDNPDKFLNLLCFPDLYPFGINAQHESRRIKFHHHEFIKVRLTYKHP